MKDARLQNCIFNNVFARGYLRGRAKYEINQQVLKAMEELGEVARQAFDGENISFEELADVCIPLFNIAAIQDRDGILRGDLVSTMMEKSSGDIKRGRRNGQT